MNFTANQRVEALQEYDIMDTPSEISFDNLTELANFICGTPISLVTLLDFDRQWFKSKQGLTANQTPIEQAFCAHAIKQPEVMIVRDATKDSRFSTNPLVTGDPHIKFYAGAPLTTAEGLPLGTLCVIDRVPRTISPEQTKALTALSRQATNLLELRRTVRQLTTTIQEKKAAVAEVAELKTILPMCSYCKKIRDDQDFWHQVENYFSSHSQVNFSHGICPDCMASFKRELAKTENPPSDTNKPPTA